MKALIPSHKENKRYLLVRLSQVRSDSSKRGQIKGNNPKEHIEKAILDFSGVMGLSKCGLSFIKSEKDSAVICINREAVDLVRASICVFPEKMEVLKVSGTLKKIKDFHSSA